MRFRQKTFGWQRVIGLNEIYSSGEGRELSFASAVPSIGEQ
jgi:hypothetical protein